MSAPKLVAHVDPLPPLLVPSAAGRRAQQETNPVSAAVDAKSDRVPTPPPKAIDFSPIKESKELKEWARRLYTSTSLTPKDVEASMCAKIDKIIKSQPFGGTMVGLPAFLWLVTFERGQYTLQAALQIQRSLVAAGFKAEITADACEEEGSLEMTISRSFVAIESE